jgi:hypothetical protein
MYADICRLPGNDVAQVHRYLDPGAKLDICHAPVDVFAADAVRELQAFGVRNRFYWRRAGPSNRATAGLPNSIRKTATA